MLKENLPLTREVYITLNMGEIPKKWTAEEEASLPDVFQHYDWDKR